MNKEPILSICIPTYNRGEIIEQSILKMLSACKASNIHIFVADNASTDNTQEVMRKYENQYDFIHYHRHSVNIGPDDNFEFVLKMATTKYRWLMSDPCYVDNLDDLMTDLESKEWDVYVATDDRKVRSDRLPKEKVLYNESISVMKEIGWHLTWISCMIYNERLINSFNFLRYKDSCFNQTALLFEPTANRECAICFNPNLRVKNVGVARESGWHYHVFDVLYRKWYLLVMSLPLYYPYEVKKKCIEDNHKNADVLFFRAHLLRRMSGKWNIWDLQQNKFFVKQAKGDYYKLFVLGILPPYLLRCIMRSGHIVKSFLRGIQVLK